MPSRGKEELRGGKLVVNYKLKGAEGGGRTAVGRTYVTVRRSRGFGGLGGFCAVAWGKNQRRGGARAWLATPTTPARSDREGGRGLCHKQPADA